MQEKDPRTSYGIGENQWMIIKLDVEPVINQQIFFAPNNDIKNAVVTGITTISKNNVGPGPFEGYELFTTKIYDGCCVYLVSPDNNILMEHHPAQLFDETNISGYGRQGKKVRYNMNIDPEKSFIIFKELDAGQTYPALFALNVILKS